MTELALCLHLLAKHVTIYIKPGLQFLLVLFFPRTNLTSVSGLFIFIEHFLLCLRTGSDNYARIQINFYQLSNRGTNVCNALSTNLIEMQRSYNRFCSDSDKGYLQIHNQVNFFSCVSVCSGFRIQLQNPVFMKFTKFNQGFNNSFFFVCL